MADKGKEPKKSKERILKRKWDALKARGIHPPENEEEARKRLKDAHGY